NIAWRQRTLKHPACQPQLNLMVEDSSGDLCGFFIGWMAQVDGRLYGQVEPLGISPAFQGAGLGRALLSEGLKRMYELGAGSVFVETDFFRGPALALYERCGFAIRRTLPVFRKDYTLP
ncbi:MAG: GNAT family N-acetyltransferase, partial [Anaerolineaceae bacterium]